jgi:deoxyribodipyrimidine photolyase-related protein
MMIKEKKTLRLILGDQLHINHSWFEKTDDNVTYVLMEVKSETDYAKHHIQKVLGFFAAMRNFAEELSSKNHQVIYIHLNDKNNHQSFDQNCNALIQKYSFTKFEYILPDEYRLDEHLKSFTTTLKINYAVYDSEHFFTSRNELSDLFKGKKTYLMETFYRYMRKKHSILIDKESKPLFDKWNFDEDNRKKLPQSHKPVEPFLFSNDLSDLENEIIQSEIKTIGSVESKNYIWPVNRSQSLLLLDFFLEHCLKWFGTYQDAMAPQQWSLYHSRLSFSLNTKMISPKEVIEKAIDTYFKNTDEIQYHQLEGFVRQILGWREYMRGIYWVKMPEYAKLNYFEHTELLPNWFWTGETKMNCIKHAIQQSLLHSYAHHIQRLMITGNFALMAGIHPDEVDAWYLGIYIDAIEWVEITNTRGMSQFADGGIVGSKPYISSASYINKMSSYCSGCYYQHDKKVGEKSCPFNSLYWNFYDKHEIKLSKNPRVSMMYNVWRKMNPEARAGILDQADFYLKNINDL